MHSHELDPPINPTQKEPEKENVPFEYTLPLCLRSVEDILKEVFRMEKRRATVKGEFTAGFVHFISCLYVLPVVPEQLSTAGYTKSTTIVITATCCGVGSIISGFISNMPVIIAPPTAVSIYLASSLTSYDLQFNNGNQAVVISGCLLIILGYRPLTRLFGQLIPASIQFSTAIGIGLVTCLAGCTSVNLVVPGDGTTILKVGKITPDIYITVTGIVIITVCLHYGIRVAFVISLVFCSLLAWGLTTVGWPEQWVSAPLMPFYKFQTQFNQNTISLILDLLFLYAITLNGLARAFSNLANINNPDGSVPRGRWLYVICGGMTIFSGLFGGPPILISPESGAGIKANAKTGLSAVFGGMWFCLAIFFTPLFSHVPSSGTASLLIAIGAILFVNAEEIDWHDYKDAFPAFLTLFLIPFTDSIVLGVIFGLISYTIISIFTGEFFFNGNQLLKIYFPSIVGSDENEDDTSSQSDTGEGPAPPATMASSVSVSTTVVTSCWTRLMNWFSFDDTVDSGGGVVVLGVIDDIDGPRASDLSRSQLRLMSGDQYPIRGSLPLSPPQGRPSADFSDRARWEGQRDADRPAGQQAEQQTGQGRGLRAAAEDILAKFRVGLRGPRRRNSVRGSWRAETFTATRYPQTALSGFRDSVDETGPDNLDRLTIASDDVVLERRSTMLNSEFAELTARNSMPGRPSYLGRSSHVSTGDITAPLFPIRPISFQRTPSQQSLARAAEDI